MTFLRKSKAMLRLIRPELPAAAGICVVVGQAIALGALPPLPVLGMGFLLGLFLSSSAMVFNDYFDLEVDRVNAPERPLPSGLLAPAEVIAFGLASALVALALALGFNPAAFWLSLAAWGLGFLYNWKLKAAGLWGNLIVSANVGLTFVMGGVSVGRASSLMLWTFALMAFVFDLAEEIAGDAMDMEGDRKRASQSLAILYGRQAALRISGLLLALMVALTLVPAVWGQAGPGYLVPIALMDVLIVFFTVKLLRSLTPREGRRSMRGLYLSATLGVAAFLFSVFR